VVQQLRTATLLLIALTLLTGCVYPLVVTSIALVAFPWQAQGSPIIVDDQAVGSALIGQNFSHPKYFWGRLSATAPVPYNAAASSGSNFGPLHPDLKAAAERRISALVAEGLPASEIPVDLVTSSGSGLDPHISPAAAEYQVARIARVRGISEDAVRDLVRQNTEGRQLGILGEPRVHVLNLNLALDQQKPQQPTD
jgi:K+-transporting ATPase ATPase C chain